MKAILLLISVFAALHVSAQSDSSIFMDVKKVEVTEYVLSVPQKWKKIDQVDASSKDRKFEFTGIGLPDYYKSSPVTAAFTFRKNNCDSLAPAVEFVLSELTSYPDRLTPPGQNYTRDSLAISSGETGVLFSTHFYRRTKAENYTRYDFVVYSKKRKAAYLLNVTYQYHDSTYSIEAALRLKEYAVWVFKNLLLR